MASKNSSADKNFVRTLVAVDATDPTKTVVLQVDPVTGRLLVEASASAAASIVSRNTSSTGLLTIAGGIAINADTTKVDIPAGTGQVIDNSDASTSVLTEVSYGPFNTQTIDNIGTQLFTIFSIDINGALIQSSSLPKENDLRTKFVIGLAVHLNLTTVNQVKDITVGPITNVALTIADLSNALGALRVKGEEVEISANGANLKIDLTSGKFYSNGIPWGLDNANPNIETFTGLTAPTIVFAWRDGVGGFNNATSSDFKPGKFDDNTGGATEPNGVLGADEFQNFFIWLSPITSQVVSHYGQVKYDSIIGAKHARETELDTDTFNPIVDDLVFIGVVTVRGNATDFTNIKQFETGFEDEVDQFYDNVTALGDGFIYEKPEIIEVANGTITTVEVQKDGGGDLTVQLGGQTFIMTDDGSDNLINLTHGTDTVPTHNFVYITEVSGKAILQVATIKPTVAGVGKFANVKEYFVQSAATVQADGFLFTQEVFDQFGNPDQSHIRHINDNLRLSAKFISGLDQTITVGTQAGKDDLFIALTSGVIRQIHERNLASFSNGGDIYVANDQTTPFVKITNLNAITTDTTGATLESNNDRYNLVIWRVEDKVYVNKPTGKYNNDTDVVTDLNKTAVKSFPDEFKGKAVLIARIAVKFQTSGGGTLTIVQINGADFEDLRSVSGEGGAVSITQTTFSDAVFRVFNSTDSTKQVALDTSGIATGTTRTLTVQDKNYIIADDADIVTDHNSLQSIQGGNATERFHLTSEQHTRLSPVTAFAATIIAAASAAATKALLLLVKADVGLGNVDNTSDAGKPVSTAQQTALDLKADKATLTTKGDLYVRNGTVLTRLPVGTDGQRLEADSADALGVKWVTPAGGGAYTLEGSQLTEGTTTSTTPVDIISVSSLTIAQTEPMEVHVSLRKTAGAANNAVLGIKLNSTVTAEALTNDGPVLFTSAINQAESRATVMFFPPRNTNYNLIGSGFSLASGTNNISVAVGKSPTKDANQPTAEITDVVIRALVDDASITAGVDDLHIYTRSIS